MTEVSPVRSHPVVQTVAGRVRGQDDGFIATFKGVRYAAAPVGDLRWRAPLPPKPWTDIADATRFGPVCPQPRSPIPLGPGAHTSEDCLFLNIWTPSWARDEAPLPVLVWVHGGAYIFGAGSQPLYDGRVLAGAGVVVVTLNYRLGPLGFLELEGTEAGRPAFDTNVGIRDVLRALEWVRDNISAFGGDPQRVTLFGESAGAGITTALLTSPAAQGLFHRAIVQSSPATSAYDLRRGRVVADVVLKKLGVSAVQARGLPVEAIVAAGAQAFAEVSGRVPGLLPYAPLIDGDLVPDYPVQRARTGRSNPVPLIIGTNRDEAALFRWIKSSIMPIAPKALRMMFDAIAAEQPELILPSEEQIGVAYPGVRTRARTLHVARDVGFRMPTIWFAEGHSALAPVYLYRFDWTTPMLRLLRLGAAHTTELGYVWSNPLMGPRDVTFSLGGRRAGRGVSERMRARWINFAHGRQPLGPAGEPWRPFSVEDRATLQIAEQDVVVEDLDRDIRRAWGDVIVGFR